MADRRYSFWKQFIIKLWNMKLVVIVKIAVLSKAGFVPRAIQFCGDALAEEIKRCLLVVFAGPLD